MWGFNKNHKYNDEFTDLELLRTIRKLCRPEVAKIIKNERSISYVPIDISIIATKLNTHRQIVYYRLVDSITPRYIVNDTVNDTKIYTHEGDGKGEVNFPILCSVLTDLENKKKKDDLALIISCIAIIVSLIAVF